MVVYLVEDSEVVRERLRDMVLDICHDIVVLEAVSPSAAIAGILAQPPELIVLDLKLDGGSGLDVLREVNMKLPASQVVVFSNQAGQPYIKKCMALGAVAFFDKAQDFELVRNKVRQIISAATAGTDDGEAA
jgi:DNA-binding NarL/FixJ family response regulator